MANKLDKQYQELLQTIIDYGVEKKDRTGTGTKSIFGYTIRHKMSDGFPLLTTKKMAWKTMVTELLWFLRGDTNIKYLVDNNCHIWDGDAYKAYLGCEKNNSKKEYLGSKCSLCGNISNHDTDYPNEYDTNCIHCGKEDEWEHQYKNLPSLTQEEFINKIKTDDEFAKKWGELGPIYGKQWRSWSGASYINPPSDKEESKDQQWYRMGHNSVANKTVDQIQNLINDLKTNPDSRRLMVSAWNVGELDQMVLPPCHYSFQVYTRELSLEERARLTINTPEYRNYTEEQWKEYIETTSVPKRAISLMWNQRSVDTFLGLPFNIASYGLLLEIIAKEVNMVPEELIGNLGDTHLYLNHINQAKEQIGRTSFELPTLKIEGDEPSIIEKTRYWNPVDFTLLNYKSQPTIKAPLSN